MAFLRTDSKSQSQSKLTFQIGSLTVSKRLVVVVGSPSMNDGENVTVRVDQQATSPGLSIDIQDCSKQERLRENRRRKTLATLGLAVSVVPVHLSSRDGKLPATNRCARTMKPEGIGNPCRTLCLLHPRFTTSREHLACRERVCVGAAARNKLGRHASGSRKVTLKALQVIQPELSRSRSRKYTLREKVRECGRPILTRLSTKPSSWSFTVVARILARRATDTRRDLRCSCVLVQWTTVVGRRCRITTAMFQDPICQQFATKETFWRLSMNLT